MQWLMTRVLALGAALALTVLLLIAADLASKYLGKHTHPAPPPSSEYTIELHH